MVNYGLGAVATGSVSAIIGDPKAYMIRNVQGFQIKRDEYSNSSTGMVNFYCSARLDGKIINVNDSFVKIVTA
jgi:HK97 family phage major capsid protein